MAKAKEDLQEICTYEGLTDIRSQKELAEFERAERKRQRVAQDLQGKLAVKLKFKEFRVSAPDDLFGDATNCKNTAELIFKFSKAMSQNSVSSVADLLINLDMLIDDPNTPSASPGQYILVCFRFSVTDWIKFFTIWRNGHCDGGRLSLHTLAQRWRGIQ